jgi:hypothetical protein
MENLQWKMVNGFCYLATFQSLRGGVAVAEVLVPAAGTPPMTSSSFHRRIIRRTGQPPDHLLLFVVELVPAPQPSFMATWTFVNFHVLRLPYLLVTISLIFPIARKLNVYVTNRFV